MFSIKIEPRRERHVISTSETTGMNTTRLTDGGLRLSGRKREYAIMPTNRGMPTARIKK
jgi:hypothetical protein